MGEGMIIVKQNVSYFKWDKVLLPEAFPLQCHSRWQFLSSFDAKTPSIHSLQYSRLESFTFIPPHLPHRPFYWKRYNDNLQLQDSLGPLLDGGLAESIFQRAPYATKCHYIELLLFNISSVSSLPPEASFYFWFVL